MCGIFGVIAKKDSEIKNHKLKCILAELFKLSATRGKDASGITVQTAERIFVYKKSVSTSILVNNSEYRDFLDNAFGNVIDQNKTNGQLAVMGHARMATNGSYCTNINNQPVVKNGIVTIHNGIIVNDREIWEKNPRIKREYEVDTEIVNELLRKYLRETGNPLIAVRKLYSSIEGSASLGVFFNDYNFLLLSTNTGSLYVLENKESNIYIFASELFILNSLLNHTLSGYRAQVKIRQIKPNNGYFIDLSTLVKIPFSLGDKDTMTHEFRKNRSIKQIIQKQSKEYQVPEELKKIIRKNNSANIKETMNSLYYENLKQIKTVRRCKKCILPETMPFISFNEHGICNYCTTYRNKELAGEKKLSRLISGYRKTNGKPDCIVCLSGGRDSSYALHYVKKILKMNPIAYSYDWGMLTDLGRRNQARMCAKLGVEHILVAADINQKRNFIKLNVEAWLKKPELGMIPLFMAGDKQYFYHVNELKKNNNIELVIMGENYLEKTGFKNGFAGIKQKGSMAYHVSILNKLKLLLYYFSQFIRNPYYFNTSLIDSLSAFFSYFVIPHDYLNIYDYIEWNEDLINKTLIKMYSWEKAEDTDSTWRIGDGTAAFYNYIYNTVTGFSEHDTFRSNQIREGVIIWEKAMKQIDNDNHPRYGALKWYCNTIGIDFINTIKTINSIPKIYGKYRL